MDQDIRFCKTSDGVRIAYAVMGDGPPLVWVPGGYSHLELDLTFPPFRERVERLAEDFTLVRFDKRGTGLSQREVTDFSVDAHLLEIEAIVDTLKLDRFALAGYSEGGPYCIAYTHQHPDLVSQLVLMGTFAEPSRVFGGPEMQQAFEAIVRREWAMGARFLADHFLGDDAASSTRESFAVYLQQACSAPVAIAMSEHLRQIDVRALLPEISTPTLVFCGRQDRTTPIELGQEISASIPGARFVSVDGSHVSGRAQMVQMDAAIRDFLGVAPRSAGEPDSLTVRSEAFVGPTGQPTSALVTILFTDMEGSTALTQRLGDAKAQEVLRAHNAIIRDALRAHGGSETKHTGDGIMASFGSAARALECAVAIQRSFAERNADNDTPVNVRVGLNAGEPVAEDGPDGRRDLFGATVQLAARVCDRAESGQVLVSNVVRELAMGKGFLFHDSGDFLPKGFEDPVRIYEVRWQDPPE